jgi:sulfoxide reductase catalytic subunit YedY
VGVEHRGETILRHDWMAGIDFAADYSQVGGGYGGYTPDHQFFSYRQPV